MPSYETSKLLYYCLCGFETKYLDSLIDHKRECKENEESNN